MLIQRAACRMASAAGALQRIAWMVVDFDGTCTSQDTTPLIPHLSEAHLPSGDVKPCKLEKFKNLEARFLGGMSDLAAKYQLDRPLPSLSDSTRTDLSGLAEFLTAQDDFSSAVTREVSDSGCLAGIRPSAVAETLAAWVAEPERGPVGCCLPELRAGCLQTLAHAAAVGCSIGVLSINWCPSLVEAVLESAPAHTIWSNSIDAHGRVQLHVPGAAEKKLKIVELKEKAAGNGLVVYVGDSSTDLQALLEADIGILIGESSSTRRVVQKYGIGLRPLKEKLGGVSTISEDASIWEAESWEEIDDVLFKAMDISDPFQSDEGSKA